jgi:transcriptional regulator with XRE-family HTH domain
MQAARMLIGMSQRELALEAKIPRTSLARYETGVGGLNQKTFSALFKVFEAWGVHFIQNEGEMARGVYLKSDAPILRTDPLLQDRE